MISTELPTITAKQKEILLLLYRFRFLTRPQIQTLLHHKHHNRIIHWLKDLTEKNYLKQYYDKTFASSPTIYSLGRTSRKYFKINTDEEVIVIVLDRIWREDKYSVQFKSKCIFLGDLYISYRTAAKEEGMTLQFLTKSDYSNEESLLKPQPDAYIAVHKKGSRTLRYFLDVIDDMTPRMILRKRIRQYLNYYDTDLWQDHEKKPFPKVLLICPDERSKRYLQRFIRRKLDGETSVTFFFGLKADIQKRGIQIDTWDGV